MSVGNCVFTNPGCINQTKFDPGVGWQASPCNQPLADYLIYVTNSTPSERASFYMRGGSKDGKVKLTDITMIYPMRRDTVATSTYSPLKGSGGWCSASNKNMCYSSAKDICSSPKGIPDPAVTKLGVWLFRSPTNGLPCRTNARCCDCRNNGQNCGVCK